MYLSLFGVLHEDLLSIGVRIIKRRKKPVYLDKNTPNLVTSQIWFTLTSAKKRGENSENRKTKYSNATERFHLGYPLQTE